jgi:hypothetical protein
MFEKRQALSHDYLEQIKLKYLGKLEIGRKGSVKALV